jgi:hypothetical protein
MSVRNWLFYFLFIFTPPSLGNISVQSQNLYICNVSRSFQDTNNFPTVYASLDYDSLKLNGSIKQSFNDSIRLTPQNPALSLGSQVWLTQINNLHIYSDSVYFGINYSIELCFLGPNSLKQNNKGPDLSESIYASLTSLFATTFDYVKESQLNYKTTVICDLRGKGRQTAPRASNEISPGGTLEQDVYITTDYQPISMQIQNLDIVLNENKKNVPRFCSIKFDFIEFSQGQRTHLFKDNDIQISSEVYNP